MRKYTEVESIRGTIIQYEENGVLYSIPIDPANSDYQAYLKRDEAEQSTPN
jgi:hypothetical protein